MLLPYCSKQSLVVIVIVNYTYILLSNTVFSLSFVRSKSFSSHAATLDFIMTLISIIIIHHQVYNINRINKITIPDSVAMRIQFWVVPPDMSAMNSLVLRVT